MWRASVLFPPPGAPSIRIVLGLGRNKDSKSKPSNGSCLRGCGNDGDGGGGRGGLGGSFTVKLEERE